MGLRITLTVLGITTLVIIVIYFFIRSFVAKIHSFITKRRYDDNGTLHYFSIDDYKDINLRRREGFFQSGDKKLKYYIYENDNSLNSAYIVLSHGLGAGHVQYMEEIAYFVKHGYQVFTYDARGCYASEGKGIESFISVLKDLNNALSFAENLDEFRNRKILLYGHSMGGFCVNNISIFNHKNIIGVTSVASFNSVDVLYHDMVTALGGEKLSFIARIMTNLDKEKNKEMNNITSVESLKLVNYPVLMISGDKDDVVLPKNNYFVFEKEFKDNELFTFLLVKDRYHRPNLTIASAEYCKEVDKKINEYNALKEDKSEQKKKELYDSFDYRKMVEFDDKVMFKVIEFYSKCIKM